MAFFDFFSKKQTVTRCSKCNSPLTEDDIRRYEDRIYCDYCLAEARRSRSSGGGHQSYHQDRFVDVSATPTYTGGSHPVIRAVEEAFQAANLKFSVQHIGDQWELVAGVTGTSNQYQMKFICKDRDTDTLAIRIFSLLKVNRSSRDRVLTALQRYQNKYRFLRFTIDNSDEVKVEYDVPCCDGNMGPVALEMFLRIMKIIDEIYPELMRSAWG